MITPLNNEITVTGRAESAAQAVIEGIQALAEITAGAVDGLAHHAPEVIQAPDQATINEINRGHAAEDSPCPLARNP